MEPPRTGRIVILNGAPRSGKTSTARAMQDQLDGNWINLGVDAMQAMLPAHLQPGIGLRPGGERPDLEPLVVSLYHALYRSIAAHAGEGFDVVADTGHHDSYSRPLGILPQCAGLLTGLQVTFVGVRCPIETIMARRNADKSSSLYVKGTSANPIPDPVRRWQDAVHAHGIYDLEIDTWSMTPEECATRIGDCMAGNREGRSAFEELAQR